jgi:uncharacterized protein DUF3850
MSHHHVKCWMQYFDDVDRGEKRFDLRRNDRNYKVDDQITLQEWDPTLGEYTGRRLTFRICYVLQGDETGWSAASPPLQGLHAGYAILGLAEVP